MQCDGSGYCLTVQMICNFNCMPKKCPNYVICSNRAPLFILEFNNGVCNECVTRLGKCLENPTPSNPILEILNNTEECPVCLQVVDKTVKNPRCIHKLCFQCLKAIYWYEDSLFMDIRPTFPITVGVEEEYLVEPEIYINNELVIEWKKQLGSWNENRLKFVMNNKKYLKHCPICRR